MHSFEACFESQQEKMRPEGLSCFGFGVDNGTLRMGIFMALPGKFCMAVEF